jgi:hypothetical protein
MTQWMPMEDGHTVGAQGLEGGNIMRDEIHELGGRMMLEGECPRAPFAITLDLYDWLLHTRYFADEASAEHAYSQMRSDVEAMLHITTRDDADVSDMDAAIDAFIEKYP